MKASWGATLLLSAKDMIFQNSEDISISCPTYDESVCPMYDESDQVFENTNQSGGRTVGLTVGRMDGGTDGRTAGRMVGRTVGQTVDGTK